MHSTASDGTDTPEQIITKCAKLRLQASSITDHDTIDGQQEAIDTAAEKKIKYITGVEFSVQHAGELHILGYGVDIHSTAFQSMMDELRQSRVERAHLILKRLHEQGIAISFDDVERHAQGNTLGRPHIALALMEKGYSSNLQDAFTTYLNENGLCYVRRRKLNAKEAIDLIADAGGVSVLAHPKFIRTNDIAGLVAGMAADGLRGIEAYYPAHTDRDVERFLAIAKANNLLVTAGSDYHGKMREYSAIASEKRTGKELEQAIQYLLDTYTRG
ncbi:PHP domain-containing protein [Christensenellaceae bacterium OttesenSCG-928-K19]|nr:PHP domain-containing protein [Christensenellaceae bacterium OttesenSCG-928-K19]